ncbi:hypothetical protein A5735_04270 [Mycolicibacter heraklionensis]|nr:hypothetical protein A5735_04270 [Mycolicibacter heraklionensis]
MTTSTTIRVQCRPGGAGSTDSTISARPTVAAHTTDTMDTGDRAGPGQATITTGTTIATGGPGRSTGTDGVITGAALTAGTTITTITGGRPRDAVSLQPTQATVTTAATGLTISAIDIQRGAINTISAVLAVTTITTHTGNTGRSPGHPIGLQPTQTRVPPDATIATGSTGQRTRITGRVIPLTTRATMTTGTGSPVLTRGRKDSTT